MKNPRLLFFSACLLLGITLFQLDRYYLKQNDGFCLRTILGQVPHQERWNIGTPLSTTCRQILNQPFHYLAKGHQSYVFASEDGQYVIKCYRFPSHLRLFPWLNHPISYHTNSRRQEIMQYNLEKLDLSFHSYKIAFEQLQQETGTEWIHLNRSTDLNQQIHLIDQTGNHYYVPLDSLSCVLQKRFTLIFPALEQMLQKDDRDGIKQLITSLAELHLESSRKGISDHDPVLAKNYGWDGSKAVHLDVGRFVEDKMAKNDINLRAQFEQMTPILVEWLQQNDPELFEHYKATLDRLN